MTKTVLRGMTWDHARGHDPLAACSALWRERTGVELRWDRRSLQDFETYPVEELARDYDLIVIDHPHVGQVTREGCLLPLDGLPGREADLAALAAGSVGASFDSYRWQGRQWAFPIDAATQVQAWVPGRLAAPVGCWSAMLDLARDGRVLCPLRPPHSLMLFYGLMAHLGRPCRVEDASLFDETTAEAALEHLQQLHAQLPAACGRMDPIDVFEQMAQPGSRIACVPLVYGYVSYAQQGFRPTRIAFADIPVIGGRPPAGTALGGTGMAVSAYSSAAAEAIDFAYWVASAEVQRGPYAAAGGQPGHAAAWEDGAVNAPVLDFYRATRATLEGAWVRPRHDGYMPFQQAAADGVNEALQARWSGTRLARHLNTLFRDSLEPRAARGAMAGLPL